MTQNIYVNAYSGIIPLVYILNAVITKLHEYGTTLNSGVKSGKYSTHESAYLQSYGFNGVQQVGVYTCSKMVKIKIYECHGKFRLRLRNSVITLSVSHNFLLDLIKINFKRAFRNLNKADINIVPISKYHLLCGGWVHLVGVENNCHQMTFGT